MEVVLNTRKIAWSIVVAWFFWAGPSIAGEPDDITQADRDFGTCVKNKDPDACRSACDAGNMRGCNNLGEMYRRGEGVETDMAKAIEYYRKGCDGNHPVACVNLANRYKTGQGIEKDYITASQLYAKACVKDDWIGCFTLGTMYEQGKGVKKDLSEAKRLLGRACNEGSLKPACERLEKLPADPATPSKTP